MNNNVVTNRERVFGAPAYDIACFSLARDTFGVLAQLQEKNSMNYLQMK